MKKMQKLAATAAMVFATAIVSGTLRGDPVYTINEPYRFPVRPGTSEWKQLETGDAKYQACDIPIETCRMMSTPALVETCMEYPMLCTIFSSSTSHTAALLSLRTKFTGLTELFSRSDAGKHLAQFYGKMSTEATAEKPPEIIRHAFIATLLIQDEILRGLQTQQLQILARHALNDARLIRLKHGPSADEIFAGRLATKILLTKDIRLEVVGGRSFDKNTLDATDASSFIRTDKDFIPKNILDKRGGPQSSNHSARFLS